jgi:hypothetical protein
LKQKATFAVEDLLISTSRGFRLCEDFFLSVPAVSDEDEIVVREEVESTE